MDDKIEEFAARLDDAARNAVAIEQLTAGDGSKLTLRDGYAIQRASIAKREARGARRVGLKMGFTSRAKIVQMGVSDMIWGRLTSDMLIEDGGRLVLDRYVHPRVEPEIAFLLAADLAGEITPLEAQAAVSAIAPAMEIIDSRYRDFKFTAIDVVADNSSSSGFVVGPWHRPDCAYDNLGLVMSFDGQPRQIGSTAAILGHPLRSLVAAARFAAAAGEPLRAGWIVLAGGATAAEALGPGYVELEIQALGRLAFTAG